MIRLKALGVQVKNPLTADVFGELGAHLNLTKEPKRKWYHACKNVLMPSHVKSVTAVCLSSTVGKGGCCRSFQAMQFPWKSVKKRWLPSAAARCPTLRPTKEGDEARQSGTLLNTSTDKVKMEEKANCFTLLKRKTRLKSGNSEVKSNVESCCLERHSPRGSYHLVEPAGRTHLYRKAIRILDLECIVRANQQQKVPVKRVGSNAALNSEMDWSSPVKRDRGELVEM